MGIKDGEEGVEGGENGVFGGKVDGSGLFKGGSI
jgi:hypothetical protein